MRERSYRMRRVNEAMKEVLSAEIGRGLKDPRIGFVTVTGVKTSPDLRHAKVFVSVLGKKADKEVTLKGLHSAEGYLQGVINQALHLKRTPSLEFVYDQSIDEGMKIHGLLRNQERQLGIDLSRPADGSQGGEDGGAAAGFEESEH